MFAYYTVDTEQQFAFLKIVLQYTGIRSKSDPIILMYRGYKGMKQRRLRKRVRFIFTAVTAALIGCMAFGVFFVSAHESASSDQTVYKYYKSIEIQPGDTLWGIAEETMTSEYDSIPEYVEVLKEMNSLKSDDIEAGQHLIIAYDDTEFVK